MVAAPGGAQMTGDNPKVLSAGGISMNRLVSVAASAAFLLVAGAAAAKGYTLPTRDGRCAVWITTESDPAPGESTSWSGECRNGLAQGFGIQAFERADGSRLRYVGHVRDGRWHGLGRLHQFAADGGLLHVVEGVFEQGIEQGVFDELVLDHPQNVPISNLRPPGREVGPAAVQVQQFYADGAAVLMCAPEADCAREAVTEGYDARRRPLDGELDRVLPYGGWRLDIRDERGSSQVGVCLDPSLVRPGREPRVGTLLFPSFAAWQRPLQQNWRCDDLTAVLQKRQPARKQPVRGERQPAAAPLQRAAQRARPRGQQPDRRGAHPRGPGSVAPAAPVQRTLRWRLHPQHDQGWRSRVVTPPMAVCAPGVARRGKLS
jgi:hypothetical protein